MSEPRSRGSTVRYACTGLLLGAALPFLLHVVPSSSGQQPGWPGLAECLLSAAVIGAAGLVAGARADTFRSGTAHYRNLSEHDELTGLPNGRVFHERLDRAVERAHRFDQPLALLILDVDGLKSINDRYGHSVGSAALRHVAAAIEVSKRQEDLGARWGGDEFAIIMAGAGAPAAERVGTAILSCLEAEPLAIGPVRCPVTATIGVVVARGPRDLERFFSSADEALYAAKRQGTGRMKVVELVEPEIAALI